MIESITVFFLFTFVKVANGCIPTQNVDPFPCKVCSKIYDSSCEGNTGGYEWCETAEVVDAVYNLGAPPEAMLWYRGSNVCWNSLTCPSGTTAEYNIGSWGAPYGSPNAIAYCSESGVDAGEWHVYLAEEFDLFGMRCKG